MHVFKFSSCCNKNFDAPFAVNRGGGGGGGGGISLTVISPIIIEFCSGADPSY